MPTLALNSWVQMILALLPWPPEKPELLADISFLLALNKNWFQISTSFPHHRGASQHCSSSCSSVAHAMSHLTSDRSLPKPPPSASGPICHASPFCHRLTCSGLFISFPTLPPQDRCSQKQAIHLLSLSWAQDSHGHAAGPQ